MREIPAALSTSSSSSQQNANNETSNESKQGAQSTLLNEISTLRSRLRELGNDESPMNRPRSHSALMDGGRREPPAGQGESVLVNKLRKDLKSLEEQKAEMELTLMNQMSNLAYENQTTIDSLHSRLAQSEKMIAELQQQQPQQSSAGSSPHLELHRLRKNLSDERGMRRALEEERDVRHREFQKIREEREACDEEMSSIKQQVEKLQQRVGSLETTNTKLITERDEATQKVKSLESQLQVESNAQEERVSALEAKHKAALAQAESSHQEQMQELKRSYQQRCNALEKEMSQKFDRKQSGVSSLHTKISELEAENETLVHSVAELQGNLDQEQAMNQQLERSLAEQTENSGKLWTSLEESQKRCSMLEQELSEQFESSHEQADLKKEKETLAKQAAAVQDQVAAEQEKNSKLQASLESERVTNSKLRLSLRQHQQRYEELNRNLHKSQSGVGLVNGKVLTLENERKNLTAQLSHLQDQLSKERNKTNELELSLAEKEKIIDEQLQSKERRQTDAAALENAQLELQSVLNSYQADMARLERKATLTEQQLSERNRQNQRLEVEINEERRIRKSLTAQLSQAKMANKQQGVSSPSPNGSTANSQALEAEVQRLRKENATLSDELKLRPRRSSGQIDPAEVEFLRQQNRMLGERANGFHSNQVKELETLRAKTKALEQELSELRAAKTGPTSSRCSSPNIFLQNELKLNNDLKAQLEKLKNENSALSSELATVKQQMASRPSSYKDSGVPPPSPSRRPSRTTSNGKAPPSPKTKKEIAPGSGMQTPPLSPPLMRNKKPLAHPESPSPVRGLVESIERRISRTNSSSSFASAAAEASKAAELQTDIHHQALHLFSPSPPSAVQANQAQGAQASELDDIRRELHEERAHVQDLQNRLNSESELVQNLRLEMSLLEESDTKQKVLEGRLKCREQDIARLESKTNELEKVAVEANDLREAMEQYRVTVTDLQAQLHSETEQVAQLRTELSNMDQTETKRVSVEKLLQAREAEVLKLRAKVTELEDVATEISDLRQELEKEKATSQRLKYQLSTESGLVASLRNQLVMTEEKMAKETATAHSLQDDVKGQSERVATLQNQLDGESQHVASLQKQLAMTQEKLQAETTTVRTLRTELKNQSDRVAILQQVLTELEVKYEKEKALVEDLQTNLSAEVELAAAQRAAMEESEAMRAESKKVLGEREQEIQRLSTNLSDELAKVAGLQSELTTLSQAEAKRTEEQMEEKATETQQLRSRIGELEMLLASSTSSKATDAEELDKLRGELAQADAARKEFEAKLFEERAEIEEMRREAAQVEMNLQLRTVEVEQLNKDIECYKASIEKMAKTKREDEDLIERLHTELGAARIGLEKSLDELERQQGGGTNNGTQADQDEIRRLKGELIVAKQALDINVEEMEKLQKCVKDADASRMIAVRKSMNSQQEGQQEVEKLKSELAKQIESSKGQDEEVSRLRSQVAALQAELGDALTNVEELKAMISNIQTAHDSERQDAQNHEKRANKTTTAEMNTLKVELTKNQISKADMEMEYMKRIKDLESKIDALELERGRLERGQNFEVTQLRSSLTRKEEEVRQLEKERLQICSSMNNMASSRKDEFDELNEEVMTLTAKTASQTREIHSLKMQLEEHDFRRSEFERLNNRIEELEEELRRIPPQRRSDIVSPSDVEIIKKENMFPRESVRDVTLERRSLQEKLEAMLAERSSSKSTQVLRERNAALKKEVERLTKRLKKMENNMTRFAI